MPWLSHIDTDPANAPLSAIERLGVEIQAFERYCTPSVEEQEAVDNVLDELKRVVRKHDGTLVVDVIGSRATGLAEPLSDLDINIFSSENPDVADTESSRKVLNRLYKRLRSERRLFRDLTYIKQAKVPIVLGQHKLTGIPVQFQSTPRSQPTREYVQSAMIKHPTLKPLFKIFKQALQMRGLTVGSSGGISSYPLLNMIVASLQFSASKSPHANVGNDFMAFLSFYSHFDFGKHGISSNPLELFKKGAASHWEADTDQEATQQLTTKMGTYDNSKSHKTSHTVPRKRLKGYRMTLQDPTDPLNDLGKSCTQIQDIQETFMAIRTAIRASMALWDRKSRVANPSGWNTRFAILKPCLIGDYRTYEHERADLRTFARNAAATSVAAEEP
jgi:non-canonical poly(A) RNA polymerase PAPD5/7